MGDKKILKLNSSGRSPWYHADGTVTKSYVIGVAGGSASGKTSVAERILKNLNVPWVVIVSMDSFYNVLKPEQSKLAHENNWNFDHPSSIDYDLLFDALCKLKHGKSVQIPNYDFSLHARTDKTTTIYGANVIIFEGIYGLYNKKIRDLMDLKIFVDTDADIRLARRLQRDIAERGRDLQGVLQQYTRFVKPAFDDYIQPTVKYADVIIPRGLENVVAIDLITKHVQRELTERRMHLRWDLANTPIDDAVPPDVMVLPETNQIKGMHTILRNRTTPRDEFVFYAERLSTIIVEAAFNLLPFEKTTVTTPVEAEYDGMVFQQKLCGVSILRAGGTMETGLRRVYNDAVIGKILIQTDPSTGEPQLHYCKLPADVKDHYVILMDATIGTGAAGLMAIRVLLDHEVPENHIILTVFLAAPVGLNVIAKAFPRVKIVTSMVDPVLSKETLYIEPGIGNFGDRYFGTEDD
ncbi:uracil phosphoribosyltransferase-domain-containing protein [Zychaea mexicana]|uniref:uracil phosphoribosyltransferase-domain-containing protein n=1 Tax=Zychaea mexicana TaxID=64656 RepID=UPI0022FF2C9A|nr:uracil phosphoribosyltransferase-domain-containing protein [Zychaea mexicana]KAI9490878.1 uracil phosphoribosyltransferase-domain-containing protein [Zychaea mexicana]